MALLLLLLVASLQTGSLQAAGLDLDSPQEQQLLAKWLLDRLQSEETGAATASLLFPQYDEYGEEEEEELQQEASQTVTTIVAAPPQLHKPDPAPSLSPPAPAATVSTSRFSMPVARLGPKQYYLGIFFKANWARSAQYCRYHGMHLASINSAEEQRQLEEHIQSLGLGHEHFWTSGTDQGQEGTFVWLSTGRPLTFENWNSGEPNNYKYEGGELEHCLELWNRDGKGLKWNDSPCSFETYFICEV